MFFSEGKGGNKYLGPQREQLLSLGGSAFAGLKGGMGTHLVPELAVSHRGGGPRGYGRTSDKNDYGKGTLDPAKSYISRQL